MGEEDTERREVARRLREYVNLPDDWWQETCAEFYVEKCVFGNVDRHSEAELFKRLADLIEPDTTTDTTKTATDTTKFDRDALLSLADGLEAYADRILKAAKSAQFGGGPRMGEAKHDADEWRSIARRIRELCGEADA